MVAVAGASCKTIPELNSFDTVSSASPCFTWKLRRAQRRRAFLIMLLELSLLIQIQSSSLLIEELELKEKCWSLNKQLCTPRTPLYMSLSWAVHTISFNICFFQITRGETQYHFYILPQFMSYCNKKQKPECSNTNTKIESPLAQSTISPHLHCESRSAVIAGSWDDTWAAGALHTSHMTYPSSQPLEPRHHHHPAYLLTINSIQNHCKTNAIL